MICVNGCRKMMRELKLLISPDTQRKRRTLEMHSARFNSKESRICGYDAVNQHAMDIQPKMTETSS